MKAYSTDLLISAKKIIEVHQQGHGTQRAIAAKTPMAVAKRGALDAAGDRRIRGMGCMSSPTWPWQQLRIKKRAKNSVSTLSLTTLWAASSNVWV